MQPCFAEPRPLQILPELLLTNKRPLNAKTETGDPIPDFKQTFYYIREEKGISDLKMFSLNSSSLIQSSPKLVSA